MSRNAGLFWAIMISSHFFGNIFAFSLFRDLEDIDSHTRSLVGSVLLTVTSVGAVLLLALRPPPESAGQEAAEEASSTASEKHNSAAVVKDEKVRVVPVKRTTLPSPVGALLASGRLFATRNMLLLSLTFLYTGLHLNLWSAVYGTCLGFTQRSVELRQALRAASLIRIIFLFARSGFRSYMQSTKAMLPCCYFNSCLHTVHIRAGSGSA